MSIGTVNLATSAPNENSMYHYSSLDSEILIFDRLVNATTDGSRETLHASNDASSKEKYLIGSRFTSFGNDPFEMNVIYATINSKILLGGKSSSASSTNSVAWKMYLDGQESILLPVHGHERVSYCTFVVSHPSDSFSCIPHEMIHYMRPEVVAQQNQHISSLVLPKCHTTCHQVSGLSPLVRKQHFDNPMVPGT